MAHGKIIGARTSVEIPAKVSLYKTVGVAGCNGSRSCIVLRDLQCICDDSSIGKCQHTGSSENQVVSNKGDAGPAVIHFDVVQRQRSTGRIILCSATVEFQCTCCS